MWGKNLWHFLPRKVWDVIRRDVYAEYGHKCGVCGKEGQLHAHEIWDYNDKEKVQTLTGMIALCPMCHHVKHFLLSKKLAEEGRLNLNAVIGHFLRVNKCKYTDFEKHLHASYYIWKKRSRIEWVTDISHMEQRIENARRNRPKPGKNLQDRRPKKQGGRPSIRNTR